MYEGKKRGDLLEDIFKLFPADIRLQRDEFRKNVHAAIKARLVKMDLVTREEFSIQAELLSRTRALLAELEEKVSRLESQLKDREG